MAKESGSKAAKRPAGRTESEASVKAELERTDRELVKLANQRAKLYSQLHKLNNSATHWPPLFSAPCSF